MANVIFMNINLHGIGKEARLIAERTDAFPPKLRFLLRNDGAGDDIEVDAAQAQVLLTIRAENRVVSSVRSGGPRPGVTED